MQYYMAPMEGLTGYVFRNAYQKYYGGIDKYFTPFLGNKKMSSREKNDILPEHNEGMQVVPQILANRAEDFLYIARALQDYGYKTVNLNLGCPSGTVTAKRRGAGFLACPVELAVFLDEIFEKCPLAISIKTRVGVESSGEWERLLALYEKYPLEELIIHPRAQKDFYEKGIRLEAFSYAAETSRLPLCYNGDIVTAEDAQRLRGQFPHVERMMIGRGILKNPALIHEIRGERNETPEQKKERLSAFCDCILQGYAQVMQGDKNTLFKMKELWEYLSNQFVSPERYVKKIKKSTSIREYEAIVREMFHVCAWKEAVDFSEECSCKNEKSIVR